MPQVDMEVDTAAALLLGATQEIEEGGLPALQAWAQRTPPILRVQMDRVIQRRMGPWDHTASVAVCSVLVQVVAQPVGTGLGLLLRPVIVACLATIVLPLGLWFVLGSVDVLRPSQAWLTPYATFQNLLSGQMSALAWAQWFVVVLLWGAALNAVGAARLKRRTARP
jgi:hypothetical protein